MPAEQNRCAETQHFLSGSSLKIVFQEAGTQRLVGDVSTGFFHPVVPEKFRKYVFLNCTIFHTLGGSPLGIRFLLDLLIFTLTWWDLYIIVITAIMFSPSLIAHPNGWKLFPCLRSLRRHAHKR
jgi:hypothetical protein